MRLFLSRLLAVLVMTLVLPALFSLAHAAESISVTSGPGSYTDVRGDSSKFRAMNWTSDGYVAGVNEFTAEKKLSDDVLLESEGRALPENGDYGAVVSLTKEEMGYVKFNFDQFRKYYANGGGYYNLATLQKQNYTDKELNLNIGKVGFELGLTMKNVPEIIFNYDRDYKNGAKSRLTWGSLYLANGDQKKIMPSWQEISEVTDSYNIKVSDMTFGFNWKADQYWERMRANNMRETIYNTLKSTTDPTSENALLDYHEDPTSNMMMTTLNVDRWFFKEKVYASGGYRFSQIDVHQVLSLFNLSAKDGSRLATATDEPASPSDSTYTAHTGVWSLMTTIFEPLTAITRMKVEAIQKNGESTWTKQVNATGATTNLVSNTHEKIMSYGESVSLRYSGIPRVALYNDYEFEQVKNDVAQDRVSNSGTLPTGSDNFTISRLDHQYRGAGTLGLQYTPWNHVTMSVQGRYREDETHFFNRLYYKPPIVTGNPSTEPPIWLDVQGTRAQELTGRIKWKPANWFQPSFRYQLVDKDTRSTGYPNSDYIVDTTQISNVYTADLVSQPVDDLLMTASFSFQDGKVITPNRYAQMAGPTSITQNLNFPTFDFDSYTTLFVAEYAINKDLILTGTADYTRSFNFNDFNAYSVSYGADFHQLDLTCGLRWTPKKDLTIEPKYAYYQYRANEAEVGSYNAQMVSLDVKLLWG